MESGFQQDVVSSVGAIGVMQLLPETWEFVDTVLLGRATPRNYEGNVQAGVRYLRWQLDEFGGNRRLALAGWYQGARAVREIGLYDDTKLFVRVVLAALRHGLRRQLAERYRDCVPEVERRRPSRRPRRNSGSVSLEKRRRPFRTPTLPGAIGARARSPPRPLPRGRPRAEVAACERDAARAR